MSIKFTSVPPKSLSQAILSSATSFRLTNILGWDGVALTSADFGTQAFGAFLSADRTLLELFEWNPSTVASASITILYRGLKFDGTQTTEVTANKLDWPAGTIVQIGSDIPQLISLLMDLGGAQTVTGKKTFPAGGNANAPVSGASYTAPTDDLEYASKKYVDNVAIAGAPDATLTVKGIVEIATTAEIDADTATGATGASIVARPDQLVLSKYGTRLPTANEKLALPGNNTDTAVGSGNKYVTQTGLQDGAEIYAASTTGNDTYVVTLSPVPTALHNGMTIRFKPDTANTGAATLNVNSLGALAIVTGLSTALATGDILANQVCEVVYNSTGTVWQLINPASVVLTQPSYSSVPNTLVDQTSYQTFEIMPVCSIADEINNGFQFSGVDIDPDTGGGGYILLGSAGGINMYVATSLPGISTVNTLRFDTIGANAIRIKMRAKFEAMAANEITAIGLVSTFADIYLTRTSVTRDKIRFVWEDVGGTDTLYATNSNGTTATVTDITSGVTATNWNTYEFVITSSSILFYVNGTLKATHTTNLPTSVETAYLAWGIDTDSTNPDMAIAPTIISIPTS